MVGRHFKSVLFGKIAQEVSADAWLCYQPQVSLKQAAGFSVPSSRPRRVGWSGSGVMKVLETP
jgi:hypothetical protein